MTKLTIRKCFASPVTRIYILNFLDESEKGTVRRLNEDMTIIANCASSSLHNVPDFIHNVDVDSVEDFNSAVADIIEDVSKNKLPLIHIQGHGTEHKGIKCNSGEFVSWQSLITSFQQIIEVTKGELTVIAATCFSFELTPLVELYKKMPYSFYYGYDKAITLGEMEDDLRSLYRNFLANKADISGSLLKIKCHSEYDNMIAVLGALLMQSSPEDASEIGLSKNALRSKLALDIPASEQRKLFNMIIKSKEFIRTLIDSSFHPTQRRDYLWEDVSAFLSNHGNG